MRSCLAGQSGHLASKQCVSSVYCPLLDDREDFFVVVVLFYMDLWRCTEILSCWIVGLQMV